MSLIINSYTQKQVDDFVEAPGHGLGISGQAGAGKGYLAQHIAARVLAIDNKELLTHPYVKIIDADSAGGIDSVRDLQRFLQLRVPGNEPIRRCVIIGNIDNFRHEAQNALLKVLEEPPTDTLIIATTSDSSGTLATIRSRLQWIEVKPISEEQAINSLKNEYKLDDIKKAWLMSQGSPGLLVNLLRNADHPLVASIAKARKILSESAYERIAEIDFINKDKHLDVTMLLDAMYRLLHTALQMAIRRGADIKELTRLKDQVALVVQSQKYAQANVQPKLLLTNLFYAL